MPDTDDSESDDGGDYTSPPPVNRGATVAPLVIPGGGAAASAFGTTNPFARDDIGECVVSERRVSEGYVAFEPLDFFPSEEIMASGGLGLRQASEEACSFPGSNENEDDDDLIDADAVAAETLTKFKWMIESQPFQKKTAGQKSFLATENLLENIDGVLRPHHCSLGTAACHLLFMLTRAILMPSLL